MRLKLLFSFMMSVAWGCGAHANPLRLNTDGSWNFHGSVALFAATTTKGTTTVNGNSADVDLNLRDALDHLDFTGTGRVEAWNGRLGLIAEGHYIGFSASARATSGPAAGATVNVESTQSWMSFLVGYQVTDGQFANGRPYSFDVQGGARYNRLTQEIVGSGGVLNVGGTERWWEPVIGARYSWGIADGWDGAFMVDASGFDTNGNELAWSATLGLARRFNERSSLVFGWRHYDIDFSTARAGGPFGTDLYSSGPFIGYAYTFN
ncbi:hypothetical protein NBRC116594_22990 [Shimia sp. NS0008-38b]|uniref:hypothetical protein n=1 Tax=Shimia sp. NS0008-38b TaxID=3127653 RepID=UPI003105AE5D